MTSTDAIEPMSEPKKPLIQPLIVVSSEKPYDKHEKQSKSRNKTELASPRYNQQADSARASVLHDQKAISKVLTQDEKVGRSQKKRMQKLR